MALLAEEFGTAAGSAAFDFEVIPSWSPLIEKTVPLFQRGTGCTSQRPSAMLAIDEIRHRHDHRHSGGRK